MTGSSNNGLGDLFLAGRVLALRNTGQHLIPFHQAIGRRFGVIVSAEDGEPLLVLRLADFLRECRFKNVEPLAILEK